MLNDVINGLKKENEVIKSLNEDRLKTDKNIIDELRLEIQNMKQKF